MPLRSGCLAVGARFVCLGLSVSSQQTPAYPPTPRGSVVETLHGIQVADQYRWLEQLDDPAVDHIPLYPQPTVERITAGIIARAANLLSADDKGSRSMKGGQLTRSACWIREVCATSVARRLRRRSLGLRAMPVQNRAPQIHRCADHPWRSRSVPPGCSQMRVHSSARRRASSSVAMGSKSHRSSA